MITTDKQRKILKDETWKRWINKYPTESEKLDHVLKNGETRINEIKALRPECFKYFTKTEVSECNILKDMVTIWNLCYHVNCTAKKCEVKCKHLEVREKKNKPIKHPNKVKHKNKNNQIKNTNKVKAIKYDWSQDSPVDDPNNNLHLPSQDEQSDKTVSEIKGNPHNTSNLSLTENMKDKKKIETILNTRKTSLFNLKTKKTAECWNCWRPQQNLQRCRGCRKAR